MGNMSSEHMATFKYRVKQNYKIGMGVCNFWKKTFMNLKSNTFDHFSIDEYKHAPNNTKIP